MLPFVTECFRVLQSVTEYYRVFLAHLLGPISGLVFARIVNFARVSIIAAAEIAKDTTAQRYHVFNNINIRKDRIIFYINMNIETAGGLLIASKILH